MDTKANIPNDQNGVKPRRPAAKKKSKIAPTIVLLICINVFGVAIILLLPLSYDNSEPIAALTETPAAKSDTGEVPQTPSDPNSGVGKTSPENITREPAKPQANRTQSSAKTEPAKNLPAPQAETRAPIKPQSDETQSEVKKSETRKPRGVLAFVIDDAGHNIQQLSPFLKLPFPITIAVLPGLQYSKAAADNTRAAGKELILHQPMQSINLDMDPGPQAILPGMPSETVARILAENVAEIGPIRGINNHEGSLIMQNADILRVVLDFCDKNGLYFLDSRTIASSSAREAAKEFKIQLWERSVFLDNEQEKDYIISAVREGMKIAERKGTAIMIGHVWAAPLAETLHEIYPELIQEGFSLSTIAQLTAMIEADE